MTKDAFAGRPSSADQPGTLEAIVPIIVRWRSMLAVTLIAGVTGFLVAWCIPPVFTATTTFIPPQQTQSSASAALASLGALATLGGGGSKNPADQYVSFVESTTVRDQMIDHFDLMKVYDLEFRDKTRERLMKATAVSVGKKDGLITVAVEDTDPKRAADMANQYVEALRQLTSGLAVSEAQRRRVFFEKQMLEAKDKFVKAQVVLQSSGISEGALKAAPQAAADGYARLRAELTTTEVMLQTMRGSMTENTPEVQQLASRAQALRGQLAALEQTDTSQSASADYIGKYREFKYQETLLDMMSRQYELARVDEAREGALIQVVDPAKPPEHKTRPKRGIVAIISALAAAVLYGGALIARAKTLAWMADPAAARRWAEFRASISR